MQAWVPPYPAVAAAVPSAWASGSDFPEVFGAYWVLPEPQHSWRVWGGLCSFPFLQETVCTPQDGS